MPFNTPGVYVQEISTLPPSVAEVSTAVPAFVGYVERGTEAARIGSVLDYQAAFGTAAPARFTARLAGDDQATPIRFERTADAATETLFYAVTHYFANGGGPCWVVPVTGDGKDGFLAALARVEQQDEPTLILFPQAADRLGLDDYAGVAQAALDQCARLKDRFTILDVPQGPLRDDGTRADPVPTFRDKVSSSYLSYAAAYHPYLETTLGWVVEDAGITVARSAAGTATFRKDLPADGGGITVGYVGAADAAAKVRVVAGDREGAPTFAVDGTTLVIGNAAEKSGSALVTAWQGLATRPEGFTLAAQGNGAAIPAATTGTALTIRASATLDTLKTDETALYNRVREALARERVTLPPSPAVAGAFASVDRDRGVWKAPANVPLAATVGPVTRMTDAAQELLNVDPTAGKSINAIRAFAGRGTVIWGARTLAGNDNEWRYVPVRRLFITVEESTRKASAFAVFEPNDATTWLKVKGMIESYLYGLWERGALAGSKPDQAYYVHVGLGSTMTPKDVLEGRMNVDIGIAAVRPAEFVVLRFSHRLQQA